MYKKSLAALCIATSLHCVVEQSQPNKNPEPTLGVPVEYAYEGQINKYVEGRRVIIEDLPTTVLELPASKVLLDGLKYRLPEIVESSLQKQAVDYVDSSKFHNALKDFFAKKSQQRLEWLGIHILFGIFDLASIMLLSSDEREANAAGFFWLCFSTLLHAGIECGYRETMQKKYDPIIAYLLQHKAFSSPQHSSVNRYLQKLLLQHYNKEQLKKLQTKYLN